MEIGYRKLSKSPRQNANILSIIFFGWSIPIFKKSYQKTLHPNDAFEPLVEDRSDFLGDRLEKQWQAERKRMSRPYLARALFKAFWWEALVLGLYCIFTDCFCRLTFAFILERLLSHFRENSDVSQEDALTYGAVLFAFSICSGISFLHHLFKGYHCTMKVRVALSSVIYRKALCLSQRALTNSVPGKLVNLLSNDLQRCETLSYLHTLWVSPLTTVLAAYILWREIDWAVIVGIAIILLFLPVQSYMGKLSGRIRFQTALRTDERVRFMDEIISGVQLIKMCAWEKQFEQLIGAIRQLELEMVLKNAYIRAIQHILSLFSAKMALFGTILTFVWLHGAENLTVSKMFMTAYLFNIISHAMCRLFVRAVFAMNELLSALKRLQTFLEYEENSESSLNSSTIINSDVLENQNLGFSMKNVSAEWSGVDERKLTKNVDTNKSKTETISNECKSFKLQDISLEILKGKLIFIVGPVGAGKSTLLHVLLKEVPVIQGAMGINGKISYSSQVSWTFTSKNIRQNIIFGQPMDRSRYNKVIDFAALTKDFEQFSNGDMTIIGENGAGLSGGQRARINFARALYRKADIYLIDDPLSAVDTHVQSHLFNKCIGPNGYLARQNATRILVTHQLHFMKEADWIVVMKDGRIEMQGDYNTLSKSGFDFDYIANKNEIEPRPNALTTNIQRRKSASSHKSPSNSLESLKKESNILEINEKILDEKSVLVKELEATSKGKVNGWMLLNYLHSSDVPCILILLYVSYTITQALASLVDIWVSKWIRSEESRAFQLRTSSSNNSLNSFDLASNDTEPRLWSTETYISIYSAIMLSLLLCVAMRSATFCRVCTKASKNLHGKMFHSLISTSMRFFDENPTGRIMNRFTKDLGSIDEILPRALTEATTIILTGLGAIGVTIFTDIKLSVVILTMTIIFIFIRKIYLKCSTNIMRLEGITKSPVFTHIAATLSGLSVIRSFQAEDILREEFERHQNLNTGTFFMFLGTSNAFGMSLDLMVYVFIGIVVFLFLVVNEDVSGDRVGLAITQALSLSGLLQYGVKLSADVTNHLTSVERVLEYSQLEPEKQPDIPHKVSKDWPSKGKIEFRNVSFRYSADELVLRGISFAVKPKEKVSVVGRTGAGKSSLVHAIFRLAIVDGDILLDDINTASVELSELRSRVSIIPQEPTLFSGTLRRNLDPFEEYSDNDIWSALANVEMEAYVSKNNGLQMPVQSHGQNFSTGQRQILCLARAILRKNRIIILDEATANVDLRTDEIIQKTIRESFADSTVITVAHRLNTIIDSDRVLVMDAGTAIEFDAPYLLMQKGGVFKEMVEALGQIEYDRLILKAEQQFISSRNCIVDQ
ncbi:ATP-binding cassette sub-family C member 4-like [Sitodiplosis mosellana]|uniref:ATP-binding cassette sub-family C member 4-like n=1 Tax=Sitodiplosis mosellana TaxID=263140 RepID=UPI002444E1A9|nr:ATP-binding cassette sub-family C member 4-like [Sitodiplosis mosellana]